MLPTLSELLVEYVNGTLKKDVKIHKYLNPQNQIKWIHLDELEKEAMFRNIYPSSAQANGFRGIKNTTGGDTKP